MGAVRNRVIVAVIAGVLMCLLLPLASKWTHAGGGGIVLGLLVALLVYPAYLITTIPGISQSVYLEELVYLGLFVQWAAISYAVLWYIDRRRPRRSL